MARKLNKTYESAWGAQLSWLWLQSELPARLLVGHRETKQAVFFSFFSPFLSRIAFLHESL